MASKKSKYARIESYCTAPDAFFMDEEAKELFKDFKQWPVVPEWGIIVKEYHLAYILQ